ncbi:hypothetical protein [Sporosarcina sp. FA9]|uniref:hypothetical protein n=1 Tax=Sporosarcina sp. FA9 TaxID=3413030 RepID=UPI003F659C32
MRTQRNTQFNNRQHFINYCRKISANKLGETNHIGRRKFTEMLRQMWRRQDHEEIENFIYKLSKATPVQLEASLRRLRGPKKPVAKHTGMYGIWSSVSKQFVFGIQEPTKKRAREKLIRRIGKNSFKYRFEAKQIKDCAEHREMFKEPLKFKEVAS